MEIKVEELSNVIIIRLKGRLDSLSSNEFYQICRQQLERGQHRIVIGCRELQYISSAGIRVFYQILKELEKSGGEIVLSEPDTNVRKILDLVDLSSDIHILSSFDEAIAFFAPGMNGK